MANVIKVHNFTKIHPVCAAAWLQQCVCKGQCKSDKCKCKKSGKLCNSKCHDSLICLNK